MGGATVKRQDGITSSEWEAKVHRAKTGDRAAANDLIQSAQDRVYRFCLRLTSNPTTAEDILQESLIQALQNLDKLREPGAFLSWVFQIARNCFLGQIRKRKNEVQGVSSEELEAIPDHNSTNLDDRILVGQGLDELEPDDRAILLLVDSEGLSYREVADMVGVSENALRSRLHRARQRFLKKIKSE